MLPEPILLSTSDRGNCSPITADLILPYCLPYIARSQLPFSITLDVIYLEEVKYLLTPCVYPKWENQDWPSEPYAFCILPDFLIVLCPGPVGIWVCDPVMFLCLKTSIEKVDQVGPFATLIPPYFLKILKFLSPLLSLPPSLSLSPSLSPCLNALALPSSNETLQCSLSRPHNKEEKLSPRCSYLFPSPKKKKKKVAKTLRERKKVLHQKNMATVITRPLWNPIYLAKHLYS